MTQSIRASVADEFAAAIARTEVRVDPFPHLVIEPAFSQAWYGEITDSLPGEEEYLRHRSPDSISERNPYRTAWRLKLDPDDYRTPRDPSPRYLFFVDVATQLKSALVREAFLDKLGPWLPQLPGSARIKTSVLLYRDEAGSCIGPHTDGPDKLIACIFYLPIGAGAPDCGTRLLVPRDPTFRPPPDEEYEHTRFYAQDELFEVAATVPYQPNTALAMVRSPRSFHSVSISTDVPVRYSLMYRLDRR